MPHMDTAELDRLLQRTFTDGSLQTAERETLADWIAKHAPDEVSRALARSRAFALAKSASAADAGRAIDWLEDAIKVMSRPVAIASVAQEHGSAFFSPGLTCIHEVLHQFDLARQNCDICVFTITDDRITDAIIRAHARGVQVRIITDDEKARDAGSDIDQLQMVGIPCKMDVGNPAHMHHKFALFDNRRLMTGSFNWTRSASEQNEENLIVTTDPSLVGAFMSRFESLWGRTQECRIG
jgi:mitochondrial cardiolipin hydrolase